MRRFFERLFALLWTGFAVLLIAGAALIALVRTGLPQIGAQRGVVETWLTDMVGRPVRVGGISADWSGWAPRLSVERLVILDEAGAHELIHFERADVDIAPLESLKRRELKPTRLVVSGVAMNLVRDISGQLSVAGMPPPRSPIMRWLLEQDSFAVREADLTVNDERARASYALSGLNVSVHSHGASKVITAYVDLPDMIGRHATVEIRTRGNPLDPHWEGNIDARLDGINSDYLLRQTDWRGPLPAAVPVNLVAWSQWRDGALRHSDFELAVERSRDDSHHLLEARGQLMRHDDDWRLALADIALPDVAGAKGDGRLTALWQRQAGATTRVALRAASLPIEPLAALVTRMTSPGTLRDELVRALPRGRLARLDALWAPRDDAAPRFFVGGKVSGIEAHDADNARAVTGLAFEFMANGGGGYVNFEDAEFTVEDDKHLLAPLSVAALRGALSWRQRGDEPLLLTANGLSAQVAGNALTLDGSLSRAAGAAPVADLNASFATPDATRIKQLLPLHVLHPHGETWFQEVFESGRVERGRVVVKGPLDHFPFTDKHGEFSADFSIREATLRYSRRWPVASDFDGELAFRGATLALDVTRGTISGADIAGAHIVLPDLVTRERRVQVNGEAHGTARGAIELVATSPLKDGHAARLLDLDIDGPLLLTLDLDLALFPDGANEIRGEASFAGNRITENKQHLTLDKVTGAVGFTQHDWSGQELSAQFEGTPIALAINGGLHDANYDTEFRMRGHSNADGLRDYLERYAPPAHAWLRDNQRLESLTGESDWQAVMSIPSAAGIVAGMPQRLRVESDLVGLAIALPWPFGKTANEARPLTISADIREHLAERTRISLGDAVSVEIDAARDADGKAAMRRAEVVFGSLDPQFTGTPGISLRGYIARLPLTEWTHFAEDGSATPPVAQLPLSFDVEVSDLRMLGRRFKDTRVQGTRAAERWSLKVSGPDVDGAIEVPRDTSQGVLRLELAHLHLRRALKHPDAGKAPELDPRRLPAFALNCAEFRYGKIELGHAEIATSRHANGLILDKLRFSGDDFEIGATGDWRVEDSGHRSDFNITVKAKALGALLARFGYRVGNIKHGATDIDIEANWNGTPADFALAHINGSFQLEVSNGRFQDIDPGTGRLFGLLSLQALPRRLSLDFEDLFDKGLVFDRIAGVFQLQDGNAYTNSLVIDGPSARFDLAGRTGLAARDYDQHVIVTPTLSNSLPLAGALFGPIGAGAGAAYFIGAKMFKSIPEQMNRFLRREYSITGSWDNPVVKRI